MELALLFSYSPSWVYLWQSLGRISIHFYLLYWCLELSQLMLLSGRSSLSLYMYWLWALIMVEPYMHMGRTFKFSKTQVGYIYSIKAKHIKPENDLADHCVKILQFWWIKYGDTVFGFLLRPTDCTEEWWTWLIPWQPHYVVETLLVLISFTHLLSTLYMAVQ